MKYNKIKERIDEYFNKISPEKIVNKFESWGYEFEDFNINMPPSKEKNNSVDKKDIITKLQYLTQILPSNPALEEYMKTHLKEMILNPKPLFLVRGKNDA